MIKINMSNLNNLKVALEKTKVGDKIIVGSDWDYTQEGIIVESCGKYNVWFDDHYGDYRWYDDLKEMIKSYWITWSGDVEIIEIELY